ncbi:hypothetical protein [Clostridium sp. BJN0001]|uniref:hypothetical protein n=1 Tax=Clostridium sp. BJN0001 TaxID=2930219 RepID=UPI001FCFB5C7|nr:hypothetical protein [Clostridium sp. BJN0001]
MIYVYPKEYVVPVVFLKNGSKIQFRNDSSDKDKDAYVKNIYDEIDEMYSIEETGKKNERREYNRQTIF